MQDSEDGSGGLDAPGGTAPGGPSAPGADEHDGPSGPAPVRAWRHMGTRFVAYIAAGALALGAGFGVAAVIRGTSHSADASSVIPSPPRGSAHFVADDDGPGADSQANILASTAPGLVHIVSSRGTPAGIGVLLTRSGIVLTSDQIVAGTSTVAVRLVLSGEAFTARVVGSAPGADLALLQIEGGSGFKPVAIGNSRYVAAGAAVTELGSSGMAKTFTLDSGNLTSPHGVTTIGGRRLTGLLAASAQVVPVQGIGGPLVNLSGQVIGIDVAGTGSGRRSVAFAVPINQALAIARQIEARRSS